LKKNPSSGNQKSTAAWNCQVDQLKGATSMINMQFVSDVSDFRLNIVKLF